MSFSRHNLKCVETYVTLVASVMFSSSVFRTSFDLKFEMRTNSQTAQYKPQHQGLALQLSLNTPLHTYVPAMKNAASQPLQHIIRPGYASVNIAIQRLRHQRSLGTLSALVFYASPSSPLATPPPRRPPPRYTCAIIPVPGPSLWAPPSFWFSAAPSPSCSAPLSVSVLVALVEIIVSPNGNSLITVSGLFR